MKTAKIINWLVAFLSVIVIVLPHGAFGMPFTVTEIVPGNDGNTVGLRLSAGATGALKSSLFTQTIKNGKATFELKGDIPIAGSGGSGTIPVNKWTDWEQFLVFPNGALLPIGSGQIAVTGNNVQANLEVGFAGTSTPFGFVSWGDTLLTTVGAGVSAYFPDFLADIDNNGRIDDTDALYVAINASLWLSSSLSTSPLSLGTTFLTNGGMADCSLGPFNCLPGYFFSTTPISLSDNGFVGTPLADDTTVFVAANHSSVVPEPASLTLLILGLIAMHAIWRKNKFQRSTQPMSCSTR